MPAMVEAGGVEYENVEVRNAARGCDAQLLAGMNANLHAMSQPLTALLCMLEYGAGLDGPKDVKGIIAGGLEQCERLMACVRAMQTDVVLAAEREGAWRTRWR